MKTKTLFGRAYRCLFLSMIFLTFFRIAGLRAQTYEWKWVNGDNTINQSGIYGTVGIVASTNKPGGRYGGYAWTDANGYLWQFGGAAYDASGASGFLNDLWKYNPSTNQWTWMTGSSAISASAVYGTKGTAATANTPGARYGGVSLADGNGNLWLFAGGYGTSTSSVTALYNDLWKYNIASGQWTWVSGSSSSNQTGVYGTKGTAASTNIPGSRLEAIGWIDASGNIWIFGGTGYDASGTNGFLNDLWKYTPSTGLWTWMSGSSSNGASGVYGVLGTGAATNTPGSRYAASAAIDASSNLWLFGGGYGSSTSAITSYYNDLWKYTSSTGLWTWVSGTSSANQYGVYGTQGTAATTNYPGGRIGTVNWTSAAGGNIWLLGGVGYSAAGLGYLDDFWKYNIAAGAWTWVGGDNTTAINGVYGTLGTPAAANKPGSRYSGPVTWTDASSNLWLLGGKGYAASGTTVGYLDDLWEYVNVTVLAVNWLGFTGAPSGNHTLLQWQTAEEQHNWYFTIQRSAEGRTWQNIGTVAGAGSSTAANSYQFTDEQPLSGLNYYRLQLNDATGEVQYSKTITVNFSTAQSLSWYAIGEGTVQATLKNGANETYKLMDIQGRLLQQGSLQNGRAVFGPLVHGIYLLQVKTVAGILSEKIAVP
ncbi:MAG TPA: kelch repeat-containing protein [Puia sp.]|nr:kelch repeat-containing protein [Puia sp.]